MSLRVLKGVLIRDALIGAQTRVVLRGLPTRTLPRAQKFVTAHVAARAALGLQILFG